MRTSITFVSAILKKDEGMDIGQMFIHFSFLALSGIKICLFVSNEFEDHVRDAMTGFSNVSIFSAKNIEDSWISTTVAGIDNDISLPENRSEEKDTKEFILSGHMKNELLLEIVNENPFATTHFAWIDADIAKNFKNQKETRLYLQWLDKITLSDKFITFPGCWPKLEKNKECDILNAVHWRFCGGFFMGDKESIRSFCLLYTEKIVIFLKQHKKLVWDFNVWAWMETFCENEWDPIWYRGDHNDSILVSSADLYTRVLTNVTHKVVYNYPLIENYYATSASYLYYNGRHLLNTRYVNYWIYPNGGYKYNNLIENKNVLAELDDVYLKPLYYKEIEETLPLKTVETFSKGLEDIRLYEYQGKVKYIATTAGYSECKKSRMIVGDYDVENAAICDGIVIQPPVSNADSWCEKNWIPIVRDNKIILGDGSIMDEQEELFIYKWYPMEIGKIDYETKQLKIVHKYNIEFPLFSKIRGSTLFCETAAGLIGVVHFSEEHTPRHYYHMLVLLEKDTYIPLRYTETFCFEKLGVEFCIGFTIESVGKPLSVCKDREPWDSESDEDDPLEYEHDESQDKEEENEDNYVFWISRHDRDPIMICVGLDEIKWL